METVDDFTSAFEQLSKFLHEDATQYIGATESARLPELFSETCKGGKMTRGRTVVNVVRTCLANRQKKPLTGDAAGKDCPIFQARVAGWCIEWIQAYFLVADDIMDESITRRDNPCWYKRPHVGQAIAINDGAILRSCVYRILKHFMGDKPYYSKVMELCNEVIYITELGQMLDTIGLTKVIEEGGAKKRITDWSRLTQESWQAVVINKTAHYTFYLPLILGIVIAGDLVQDGSGESGVTDGQVKDVSMLIGSYFQAKDDMLDCFGDPKVIGKIGKDIEECKCSWLAVQFFKSASDEDKATFKANYGIDDPKKVAVIKELYKKANVEAEFEVYEEKIAAEVDGKLTEAEKALPYFRTVLEDLWGATYKRKK